MKTKVRLMLGTLFMLFMLSIVPTVSAQASVGNPNPRTHWMDTDSGYSVMLKTNGRLYYKYNGKAVGISQSVSAAAVNGTKVAYAKSINSAEYYYIVLYDLKTKKSLKYRVNHGDCLIDSIAMYNGYIYYTLYYPGPNTYSGECVKISTMKKSSNTISKALFPSSSYANAFYQKNQYLVCLEQKASEKGARLRIFNMKTGKFTSTVSSKCVEFAVVGSTLYFVDVTKSSGGNQDQFTIRSSSLTGTGTKTWMTLTESNSASYEASAWLAGFAFHGGKVYVCNFANDSYTYRDYTLSTKKYTSATEAQFNYMGSAYFHCCEAYSLW